MKKKPQIFSNKWHLLTGRQIVGLTDKHFKDVTIQPNITIVYQLRSLEVATLELLENRSSSTVYRIRQTGVVYQVFQPNGVLFEYDDYESYQLEDEVDELLDRYIKKEIVHKIEEKDGEIYIHRLKPPPFRGRYTPNELSHISDIEWYENPNPLEVPKLLRKAGAFLASYLKKKEDENNK